MNTQDKKNISEKMEAKRKQTGLSQEHAAKQIGTSVATYNNIIRGNWNNISDRQFLMAAKWTGYTTSSWTLNKTRNYSTITKLCEDAQLNKRMLATAGYTGSGKTTALEMYAGKKPNSFYVLCKPTMQKKDFLRAIGRALGIDTEGSIFQMTEAVISRMISLESTLLILDDCGKLNDSCLRIIQVIYDGTEFASGIVLAGTPAFKKYIFKMAAKDKPGFRELKRRIGYWAPLYTISNTYYQQKCEEFGITDERAIKLVKNIAGDYGTLRELLTNYAKANKDGYDQYTLVNQLNVGSHEYEGREAA